MLERLLHGQIAAAIPRAAPLVSRAAPLVAAAVIVVGLVGPTAAQALAEPPRVDGYSLTLERVAASIAALMSLLGTIAGAVTLARSRMRAESGRRGAITALLLAPIGLTIGGLVVATADGGLGSGNGLGGGVVAITVGAVGVALGGLALARSRRAV